jgi:translation initiation factor IF-2
MAWGRGAALALLAAMLLLDPSGAAARGLRGADAVAPVADGAPGLTRGLAAAGRGLRGSDAVSGSAADSWGARDLPTPREVRASSFRSPSPVPSSSSGSTYGYQSTSQPGGRMNGPIMDSAAWGRGGGGGGGGFGGAPGRGMGGGPPGGGGGGYYGGYGR